MNIEAIDFLNQLNEYGKIEYADYSHLHDLLTSESLEPTDDERVARYLAMVSELGYQAALTVVESMTQLIEAETKARLHAEHKFCDTTLGCITAWAEFPKGS